MSVAPFLPRIFTVCMWRLRAIVMAMYLRQSNLSCSSGFSRSTSVFQADPPLPSLVSAPCLLRQFISPVVSALGPWLSASSLFTFFSAHTRAYVVTTLLLSFYTVAYWTDIYKVMDPMDSLVSLIVFPCLWSYGSCFITDHANVQACSTWTKCLNWLKVE